MQQIWQSLMQHGDYGNVTVASNVVHQENSQMADVLSHKGPMSLQNTTELHDSALKNCVLADKVTTLEDQKLALSELLKGSN